MKIKICGKRHRTGTSKKSGQPFNFYELYYMGSDRYVEGLVGKSFTMDPMYPFADIRLNAEYEVDFDQDGRVQAFAPVK